MAVARGASLPLSPIPAAPRVALHAFPSPTTTRFVVILAAMLAAGLFIGDWLHGFRFGEEFARTIETCAAQAGYAASIQTAGEQIAVHEAISRCSASAQYLRAAHALGGAALVLLIGAGVLFLAPPIIERRRRLHPVAAKLPGAAGRVAELAYHAGLRRAPTVMLGRTTQRDAFSYGSPGRHKIALPPAVAIRWKSRSLFDPLVLHELAHLRNRDVGFSWLTRGAMYAVVPILALPLIAGVATNDFSLVKDYVWRAAILLVAVWIIAIALLRSREHDADIRAASLMDEPTAIIALVSSVAAPTQSWWRRLTANHPTPATRVDILTHPHRAADVKFLDGLVPAFLAASALPLIEAVATSLATGNDFGAHQGLVAPAVGGMLLGCTVGIGVWRSVVVDRATGVRPAPWIAASGVAVGLVLGQVASLANTTTGLRGGLGQPLLLIIPTVAGLAATAIVYSLAELAADAAARTPSPRWVWVPGVAIASLAYCAALYLSDSLQLTLDVGHWSFTRHFLTNLSEPPLVLLTVVAAGFTTVAVVFARSRTGLPAWLVDRPGAVETAWSTAGGLIARPLVVGLVCGVCAVIPYGVYRNSSPNELNETRVVTLIEVTTWTGATAGAAAAAALILCVPRRGLALATLAGPVAIATFMLGFSSINVVEGNVNNSAAVLTPLTSAMVGLSSVLVAAVAPLALIPRILDCGMRWSVAVAAFSAISMCTVTVAVTANATPYRESDLMFTDLLPPLPESMAAAEYLTGTGKDVSEGVIRAYRTLENIPQILIENPVTASRRIRVEVIEPLTALGAQAKTVHPRSPTVAVVHADGIALIDSFITSFGRLADGLASRDYDAVLHSVTEFSDSTLFDRWASGMDKLRAAATSK